MAWNPNVGLYYEPDKNTTDKKGFSGIIAALQEQIKAQDGELKVYPENYAGIIEAIQDLKFGEKKPGSEPGPLPPGDIIDNSDPDNPIYIPGPHPNGELWFDTRQGRLFVYTEVSGWTQTNGADGLPVLLPSTPTGEYVVPGQLWWNTVEEVLYIFTGTWIDTDGAIATPETRAASDTPVWSPISGIGGSGELQTTATLPLAVNVTTAASSNLPDIDMSQMNNQNDYNQWLNEALEQLDTSIGEFSSVVVSDTAPEYPKPGQLWYDINSLDLSIWYVDDGSQQWVPTSSSYMLNEDVARLSEDLATEKISRNLELLNINSRLDLLDRTDDSKLMQINQDITALNNRVNEVPTYDLAPYALKTKVQEDINAHTARLTALEVEATQRQSYVTRAEYHSERNYVDQQLETKASPADVAAVAAQIPDVSLFVTQQNINDSIAGITNNFLSKNGGEVNGHFIVKKSDADRPAFDVSYDWRNSRDLFKLKAKGSGDATATFGATSEEWQYAWKFENNEDFAWMYDGNKVFSVSKEGPACKELFIGTFTANNQNGRTVLNRIEVGEELRKYKQLFADIRQAVSQSTDYATLKTALMTALPNS